MNILDAIKIVKTKCMFVKFTKCFETKKYFLFVQDRKKIEPPVAVRKDDGLVLTINDPSEFNNIINVYNVDDYE